VRPVIGITVSIDASGRLRPATEVLFVRRSYARAVAAAGGLPFLVPPDADPVEATRVCDGFVVSGGADLPESFAAPAGAVANAENADRIAWDRRLLDGAHALGRPLLAVCYGMQLLNLHHGGTLLVNIAARLPAALDHGGDGRASQHDVIVARESALFAGLGPTASVCSRHRQAVAGVAPGFRTVATAPDGVIEAIEAEGGDALGVEWHPESDATAAAVYGWLIGKCRRHAQ
jgi:putative glutamine amidotransferase